VRQGRPKGAVSRRGEAAAVDEVPERADEVPVGEAGEGVPGCGHLVHHRVSGPGDGSKRECRRGTVAEPHILDRQKQQPRGPRREDKTSDTSAGRGRRKDGEERQQQPARARRGRNRRKTPRPTCSDGGTEAPHKKPRQDDADAQGRTYDGHGVPTAWVRPADGVPRAGGGRRNAETPPRAGGAGGKKKGGTDRNKSQQIERSHSYILMHSRTIYLVILYIYPRRLRVVSLFVVTFSWKYSLVGSVSLRCGAGFFARIIV